MEHLAIVVPMIMVPLTLLALYGVIWPSPVDASTRTLQAGKEEVACVSSPASGDLSYR